MENSSIPTWAAILLAFFSLVGGTFGTWIINFFKQKNADGLTLTKQEAEIRITANEQALKFYKEILDALKENIARLERNIKELENQYEAKLAAIYKEHAECREQNVSAKAQIAALAKEVEFLKKQVLKYEPNILLP